MGVVAVVAAALLSGLAGAWLGAWTQTRHDRRERLRDRRIAAADDLTQAWGRALFVVDMAIDSAPAGQPTNEPTLDLLNAEINKAVMLSARVDLLFDARSVTSQNSNALMRQLRLAVQSLRDGDSQTARRHQLNAGESMGWLVTAAAQAIASTGRRTDALRTINKALDEADIDPAKREGSESARSGG
jgi:hypothetical protein